MERWAEKAPIVPASPHRSPRLPSETYIRNIGAKQQPDAALAFILYSTHCVLIVAGDTLRKHAVRLCAEEPAPHLPKLHLDTIENEHGRHNAVAEVINLPLKLHENTVTLLLCETDEPEDENMADETGSEVPDTKTTLVAVSLAFSDTNTRHLCAVCRTIRTFFSL